MASKNPTKLTSCAAIERALASDVGTRMRVTFKDITHREWLADNSGTNVIVDAGGDPIQPSMLAAIVTGEAREYAIVAQDDWACLGCADEAMWVSPECVKSIVLLPSPKTLHLEGTPRDCVATLMPDGTLVNGAQTLTKQGCEQLFLALADHLGYEVTG